MRDRHDTFAKGTRDVTETMNSDELTRVLESVGLSPYQADAYVTLLDLGSAPATEIADASGVPDPRIYDVLRDLESEGFVEIYQQNSLTARAHDPTVVLETLRARSNEYRSAAEEIEERWRQPPVPEHEISVVKRFDTVIDRARDLIAEAETVVQAGLDPQQYERLRPAMAAAHDRGVDVKVSLGTEDDDRLPDFEGCCSEARRRPLPSPFLVIVDHSWICFAPHQQTNNEYGIIIDDRSHAYIFHWFFFSCLWDIWSVIHTEQTGDVGSEYTNLREFVRDVVPLLDGGTVVEVTVRCLDTDTGEDRELNGRVVDVYFDGIDDGNEVTLADLAGRVSITVDAGDRVYDVGGTGAVIEDVEAATVRVESVDED